MQVRFVEADVVDVVDKLIVIKSDEITMDLIQGVKHGFRQRGMNPMIIGLGTSDSLESITKEYAIRILKIIAEGKDEEPKKCASEYVSSDGDRTDEQG